MLYSEGMDTPPIPLLGQSSAWSQLRGTVAAGRLPHAYLFAGPHGVGKRRTAIALAQCLLCEVRPENELWACGSCPGCRQVLARTHPDLLTIGKPTGKASLPIKLLIGENESRGKEGLCHDLSLRPMAGGRRMAVIDDAETMDAPAANALLKTLEEPPPHSVLILLAPSADSLLPTIRSRCQIVRFKPLEDEIVAQLLLEQGLTEDAGEAAEVAALSHGSLDLATQLLEPTIREHRQVLFDGLSSHPFAAPQLAKQLNTVIEAAGTERSAKLQHALKLIQFGVEFFRQSLLQLSRGSISGQAVIPQVARFTGKFRNATDEQIDMLGELLERCMTAEWQLEGNTSIPLCIESLLNDLARIQRNAAT